MLSIISKDAIAAIKDLPDDVRRNAEAFLKVLVAVDLSVEAEEIGRGLMRGALDELCQYEIKKRPQ